jgi:hypothetical protein
MRSSVELMRSAPEMFVVLNEIMIRARRDAEISCLVSVPLLGWKQHIISLLLSAGEESDVARRDAEEIATACMAQLLGFGLLLSSTDQADAPFESIRDRTAARAIEALTKIS